MGQVNPLGVAGSGIVVKHKMITGGDRNLFLFKCSDAKFRSLKVDQHADRPLAGRLDGANGSAILGKQLMGGMAHVDAEDIRTGQEEALDLLRRGRGGTQRGDNLYATISPHWFDCSVVFSPERETVQSDSSLVSTSKKPVF